MSWGNKKKSKFLESIPTASLDSTDNRLATRCKFNFSYMDLSQDAGQTFSDWNHEQLYKLLDKLMHYGKESLEHWTRAKLGKHHVLDIYGGFPRKSAFVHPKHVPHQAEWGRFRLEGDMRLVGFVLPSSYKDKVQGSTGAHFDTNTFYVVFLDAEHQFYLSK